jgi:tRNA 2-thiouridine synthesizing protein A
MTGDENTSQLRVDRVLDTRGLACPLPILKTKVELTRMQLGEILHVLATDPLAPLDFRAFCLRTEHELRHVIETDAQSEFFIQKGS